MKRILILFTGGTISMQNDAVTGAAVPALSGEAILEQIPGLSGLAEIGCRNFGMIPGPHMTPERMLELYRQIERDMGDYDGFVVTHGTDSLEETAMMVDLLHEGSEPIIFVGSMKNSSELGWDGPENLIDAVRTAASEDARDRGAMVVMGGEIHSASQVTKTSTHTLHTFKSKEFGPVGFVHHEKVHFYYRYTKRQTIPTKIIEPRVDLIKCGCGMDDRFLRFSVDSGAKGIVIEGMGKGNIPPGMVSGVEYAIRAGIPVVLVSRCLMGKVMDDYGYPGAGRELTGMGVILGDNLPGQKARIKLMVALGVTRDIQELRKLFEQPYY